MQTIPINHYNCHLPKGLGRCFVEHARVSVRKLSLVEVVLAFEVSFKSSDKIEFLVFQVQTFRLFQTSMVLVVSA